METFWEKIYEYLVSSSSTSLTETRGDTGVPSWNQMSGTPMEWRKTGFYGIEGGKIFLKDFVKMVAEGNEHGK